MPTVLRWNGYRFFFFSNERGEPPHVHIDKAGNTAKIWLASAEVARNVGFNAREIAELSAKVEAERAQFLEAWREHFSGQN
ncbi:hypothetical protein QO010_003437 [Caulobacter ginsengisoli]|uniref:DUF4160 domain-containing protein n=1 Tax=Caulobacter ginsengisoli TaxID=400775 RepID=A0ABU0IUF4_9CAUL|nr:DUF4160 domain-containing protein [Caulobacter ginsengisoli]MDQ0465648.1 hypothetical protein [Caulobacter ginsengisoli]